MGVGAMPMTTRYTVVDGEILAMEKDGAYYEFVPDTQGNVAMVLDASGNVVYEAEYGPTARCGRSRARTRAT